MAKPMSRRKRSRAAGQVRLLGGRGELDEEEGAAGVEIEVDEEDVDVEGVAVDDEDDEAADVDVQQHSWLPEDLALLRPVPSLCRRYGVPRRTGYGWLTEGFVRWRYVDGDKLGHEGDFKAMAEHAAEDDEAPEIPSAASWRATRTGARTPGSSTGSSTALDRTWSGPPAAQLKHDEALELDAEAEKLQSLMKLKRLKKQAAKEAQLAESAEEEQASSRSIELEREHLDLKERELELLRREQELAWRAEDRQRGLRQADEEQRQQTQYRAEEADWQREVEIEELHRRLAYHERLAQALTDESREDRLRQLLPRVERLNAELRAIADDVLRSWGIRAGVTFEELQHIWPSVRDELKLGLYRGDDPVEVRSRLDELETDPMLVIKPVLKRVLREHGLLGGGE